MRDEVSAVRDSQRLQLQVARTHHDRVCLRLYVRDALDGRELLGLRERVLVVALLGLARGQERQARQRHGHGRRRVRMALQPAKLRQSFQRENAKRRYLDRLDEVVARFV